jgi:hypothetical protein
MAETVLGYLRLSGRMAKVRGAASSVQSRILKTTGEAADAATPDVMARISLRLASAFERSQPHKR